MHMMLLMWLCVSSAVAGAFGVEMATKPSDLPIEKDNGDGTYDLKSVPLPHDEFFLYSVYAPKDYGVVRILASSNPSTGDMTGVDIRRRFDVVVEQLTAKYGKPKLIDFIQSGSIWNEPVYWARSIKAGHRTLLAAWEPREGWPPDIDFVLLRVHAMDNFTYMTLSYDFKNMDAFEAEVKKASQKGL